MIIKIVLIGGLLLCLFYAFLQRQKAKRLSLTLALISVTGMVLVAFPALTTDLADAVGVGRGADLILYCWLVISLLVSVNLQFKIILLQRHITELARAHALATAEVPALDK